LQGYEADDLIAAYTHAATHNGAQVSIVSSDKDLMQLVTDRVNMIDTMKDKKIGPAEVLEKFEVGPERVIDVQSLAGDSVDNVPGVPGIGIKTAALLINEYGDLETLLERAGEIKQNKRRENLIEFADQARISRELVMLRTDTPLPIDLNDMVLTPPEAEKLMGFLKAMEFNTLTQRVGKRYDLSTEDYEASAELAAKTSAVSSSGVTESPAYDLPSVVTDMPPIDAAAYECVTDMTVLDNWIEAAIASGYVAIDTETDGLDAVSCRLVGVSLATRPGHACYIPLAHGISEGLALADDVPQQLAETDVLARLKPLLQDASIMKILQNAKFDLQVLTQRKIEVHPVEDTMLMSYALAAGQRGHGMDELSELYLGHKPISIKELLGTGKSQITFDQVPLEKAAPYAAEDADITFRLWQMMRSELVKDRVVSVYQTTEKPLVPVIVDMEKNGISVDRNVLSRLSGEFAQKMAAMEDDIYKLAGETFNIASPKQLGDILFDKMGLPGGKKTKTGAWGTGADVLEGLAAEGHDLAAQVLESRGLAKLKSTYTDALPEFINPDTGRIHTSYSLASTTTGRLASSDPNLQNIPIRTEDGRRIRTAFVAEKGNLLVSADYSQIELRLLAHIADIDSLRQAFADGQDIHAMTASEMFGVPLAEMTPETRRRAKAINFGIIYGISAFGLANQLGISRGEASAYIKAYFEKFPGIKDYMEAVKQEAHAQGYVSTLFGRRIYLREIDSKIPARRAFAERAAINAPIQGTAADIIRRAMIAMPTVLKKKSPKSRMLLQVHDELIFEAPEAETDKLMQHVREVMQNACAPRLLLSVPLVVEAQAAKNWDEAH
jgi:DNA polymerase-1